MKYISSLLLALTVSAMSIQAQDKGMFSSVDLGLTVGSTGVGFEVSSPMGEYARLRVGGTFMPRFEVTMPFGVQVGNDPALSGQRFEKVSSLLYDFTGYRVNDHVDMLGKPTFHQAKILVDITPLRNKHWHLTAGLYLGNPRVARAYNTTEDMTSLLAVGMYNNMYWKAVDEQPFISYNGVDGELPPQIAAKFAEYGTMAFNVGEFREDHYATQDIYYDHDVYDHDNYAEDGNYLLLHHRGEVQYHKGELQYHKGDRYLMTPGQDNMVKARARVNAVRPYLGLGYLGTVDHQQRISLGVDCGVLFWGGRPSVVTHDGVDMMNELTNLNGQVGKYIDLMKHFPVYPVLELKVSYRL